MAVSLFRNLVLFVVLLAVFGDCFAAGPQVERERGKSAGDSKVVQRNDSSSDELRKQIEPGVVVYGRPHRFAEVGNCQGFDSSPDGRTLVFASGKIKFFDLIDNQVTEEAGEPSEYYQQVRFSPDGRFVFGMTNLEGRPFIRVFDAIIQSSVGTITTDTEPSSEGTQSPYFFAQNIIVSADAKYIALHSHNEIQVREVRSGELTLHLKDLGYVQSVAFSPDETELYVPRQGSFSVYDLESGKPKTKSESNLAKQSGNFICVNLSRNLVAIAHARSVKLFDAEDGKKVATIPLPAGGYAQQVAFSDDGSRLGINSWVQTEEGSKMAILVADVDTKKIIKTVHVASQGITKVAFAFDKQSLFVSGHGIFGAQEIRLDQEDELTENKYPSGPAALGAFHPDGKSFITCSQGGEVTWFDAASGDVLRKIQKSNVNSVDIINDGSEVIITSRWGNQKPILRLDYATAKEKKTYSVSAKKKAGGLFSKMRSFMVNGGPELADHTQTFPIASRLSSDETELNVINMEMSIQVVAAGLTPQQTQEFRFRFSKLDTKSGKQIATSGFSTEDFGFGKREWVQSGDIHPEGRQFVTSKSNNVFVGDTETGDMIEKYDVGTHVSKVHYSPDGKYIYASTHQGVNIWDSETGTEVKHFELRMGIPKIAFSKNGTRMAICNSGAASSLEIYDTSSWRKVFERKRTEANRNSVSFSNDGTKLLIGLSDCRMEVWDLAVLN